MSVNQQEGKLVVEHAEDVNTSKSVNSYEDEPELDQKTKDLIQSVGPKMAPLIPDLGPWYKNKHLLKLNLMLGIVCLSSSANGYDNSLINSVQAFPEWDVDLMGTPRGEWLGFIVVTLAIGAITGVTIGPFISDRWGRLLNVRLGTWGLIAFGIGQAFVKTDTQYIILRVFIGIASGLCTQTVVLVAELSFPTYRGFFTCFYMTMYYAGSFLGSWTAYGARDLGDWSWRTVSMVQAAYPIAVATLLFNVVPESPRYYVSKGNLEKAREILIKWHAGDDPRFMPLVEN